MSASTNMTAMTLPAQAQEFDILQFIFAIFEFFISFDRLVQAIEFLIGLFT